MFCTHDDDFEGGGGGEGQFAGPSPAWNLALLPPSPPPMHINQSGDAEHFPRLVRLKNAGAAVVHLASESERGATVGSRLKPHRGQGCVKSLATEKRSVRCRGETHSVPRSVDARAAGYSRVIHK